MQQNEVKNTNKAINDYLFSFEYKLARTKSNNAIDCEPKMGTRDRDQSQVTTVKVEIFDTVPFENHNIYDHIESF